MSKNNYELPSLNEARKRTRTEIEKTDFEIPETYLGMGEGKTYYIRTHGCQANQRDSETMAGIMDSLGFVPVEEAEKADVILINTCAIRQGAEEKVYGEIGALKKLKKEKPDLIIALGGCMSQEERTVREIISKYPQVEIVFGTHNITSLPKLLHDVYALRKRQIEVFSNQGSIVEKVPVTRFMKHKAWVNIMYGCDKFCTYCIVPYTRGKERSRHIEDIVFEVQELVKEGYKEVCLLGQNVNAYGKDLPFGYGFARLLDEVAATGIDRIRFMTSHPWDFDAGMVEAIKRNPNVMPYIHLPVQSGNNEILRRMNRRYTIEQYKELFDLLKKEIPNCAFTTDIIVGFPNETKEMFEDTLKIVDYCRYDNAFTFVFSAREGTPAARMEDSISQEEKEERLQILNKKVTEYARYNNEKFMDKTVEVLVDGLSKNNKNVYSGYTKENKLVNFTASHVEVGELVNVKITEVMSFSLRGVMIEK